MGGYDHSSEHSSKSKCSYWKKWYHGSSSSNSAVDGGGPDVVLAVVIPLVVIAGLIGMIFLCRSCGRRRRAEQARAAALTSDGFKNEDAGVPSAPPLAKDSHDTENDGDTSTVASSSHDSDDNTATAV